MGHHMWRCAWLPTQLLKTANAVAVGRTSGWLFLRGFVRARCAALSPHPSLWSRHTHRIWRRRTSARTNAPLPVSTSAKSLWTCVCAIRRRSTAARDVTRRHNYFRFRLWVAWTGSGNRRRRAVALCGFVGRREENLLRNKNDSSHKTHLTQQKQKERKMFNRWRRIWLTIAAQSVCVSMEPTSDRLFIWMIDHWRQRVYLQLVRWYWPMRVKRHAPMPTTPRPPTWSPQWLCYNDISLYGCQMFPAHKNNVTIACFVSHLRHLLTVLLQHTETDWQRAIVRHAKFSGEPNLRLTQVITSFSTLYVNKESRTISSEDYFNLRLWLWCGQKFDRQCSALCPNQLKAVIAICKPYLAICLLANFTQLYTCKSIIG